MINKENTGMSRRNVLKGLAAGTIAAAGGLAFGSRAAFAGSGLTKVRLAWAEPASCHAPFAFAIDKGMFKKQGIDLELTYHGLAGADQIKAIDAGETDMGSHLLIDWLKPIYDQNSSVKIIAGTHDGCQRILVSSSSKIASVQDLKGKSIAVGGLGDVAHVAFLVTVAKAGLDPHKDVNWVEIPYGELGEAVNTGKADALATLDALAYLNKSSFNMREIANTHSGHYHGRTCCVLGVNGEFLRKNRDVVQRATTGVLDAYDYAAAMPREVSEHYISKYKPGYTVDDLTAVLAALPLRRHPLGEELVRQTADSIDEMKEVKVLSSDVNTAEFASHITDNIIV